MKANELMIGDWVETQYTPRYYKVKGIDIYGNGDACRLTFEEHIVDTWCDRVNPIPLTEEILKANGFGFGRTCYKDYTLSLRKEYLYKDSRIGLRIKSIYFVCDLVNIPLSYVHELQHALRLCGLNELADNFKLE